MLRSSTIIVLNLSYTIGNYNIFLFLSVVLVPFIIQDEMTMRESLIKGIVREK